MIRFDGCSLSIAQSLEKIDFGISGVSTARGDLESQFFHSIVFHILPQLSALKDDRKRNREKLKAVK